MRFGASRSAIPQRWCGQSREAASMAALGGLAGAAARNLGQEKAGIFGAKRFRKWSVPKPTHPCGFFPQEKATLNGSEEGTSVAKMLKPPHWKSIGAEAGRDKARDAPGVVQPLWRGVGRVEKRGLAKLAVRLEGLQARPGLKPRSFFRGLWLHGLKAMASTASPARAGPATRRSGRAAGGCAAMCRCAAPAILVRMGGIPEIGSARE